MRIEKINDKQIRCTLNKKDLSDRELRISELAYGTDKAKALFRDMMQQASYEFGFEADNIPLMIEAIPMYPDALVLVITKVEEPDELDTRFSTFSDDPEDDDYEGLDGYSLPDGGLDENYDEDEYDDTVDDDEVLNFTPGDTSDTDTDFISLSEALGMEPRPETTDKSAPTDIIKIYKFNTLEEVSTLADNICDIYKGENILYKDDKNSLYYLIMHKSEHSPEEFNKICNITGEYGTQTKNMYASHSYLEEHFDALIAADALQVLNKI